MTHRRIAAEQIVTEGVVRDFIERNHCYGAGYYRRFPHLIQPTSSLPGNTGEGDVGLRQRERRGGEGPAAEGSPPLIQYQPTPTRKPTPSEQAKQVLQQGSPEL